MTRTSRYTLVAVLLVAALVFARLGIWQLDRLEQRRAANAVAAVGRAEPSVSLNEGLGAAGSLDNRRVTATGTYDHGHEFVIRGQVYRDAPGVHVLTPLRLAGSDTAVMVNRGFVPAPDALTAELAPLAEPGTVDVRGLALPLSVEADSGRPLTRDGQVSLGGPDLAAIQTRVPYPVLDVYILQSPDSGLPRLPVRLEPAPLDEGPHRNYAIQWFAFTTIAVVFAGIFLVKR